MRARACSVWATFFGRCPIHTIALFAFSAETKAQVTKPGSTAAAAVGVNASAPVAKPLASSPAKPSPKKNLAPSPAPALPLPTSPVKPSPKKNPAPLPEPTGTQVPKPKTSPTKPGNASRKIATPQQVPRAVKAPPKTPAPNQAATPSPAAPAALKPAEHHITQGNEDALQMAMARIKELEGKLAAKATPASPRAANAAADPAGSNAGPGPLRSNTSQTLQLTDERAEADCEKGEDDMVTTPDGVKVTCQIRPAAGLLLLLEY